MVIFRELTGSRIITILFNAKSDKFWVILVPEVEMSKVQVHVTCQWSSGNFLTSCVTLLPNKIYGSVDHVGQSGQCGVRSTNLGYRPEGVISDKNAQISKILTGLSGVLLLCGAKDVSTTVEHCSYRHTTTFPSCRRRAQRLRRRRQRRVHLQPRRVRPSLSTPISRQDSIQ